MKELYLNIGHIGLAENVLGSGKRLVIWVAGCPFRCPGCSQPEFLEKKSGKDISLPDLIEVVCNAIQQLEGITISGGEPLWQSNSLRVFLEKLPSSLDKMVFTGYRIGELDESQLECLSKFDLVVDGRFENNKKGDFLWRGSSNQEFHSPTGKYSAKDLEHFRVSKSAGLEVTVRNNELFFYGVPADKQIEILIESLKDNGINILDGSSSEVMPAA